MPDRLNPEALFLEHLDWIDRVASIACSKHGVRGDEAEDFAAWVRMKLMEDDYAVLRRFRGDSELKTYLTSVVARHFVSFFRTRRGRWRPSAAAERLGTPAKDLEELVRRDGYTLTQAGEELRAAGRTTLSDAELTRLLSRLPRRVPLQSAEVDSASVVGPAPEVSHADEQTLTVEADTQLRKMMGALDVAMQQLDWEEKLIVQMHFADGVSLADVARALRLEQKPLYRRVERLRTRLRALLESVGVRGEEVRGFLNELKTP